MKTLVIATHNEAKGREMRQILSMLCPWVELATLADYDDAPEPEESGDTYAANAVIKARSAAAFTGEWALADDAGLEIDALGGRPGHHSKRFAGDGTSFGEKMRLILQEMEDVPEELPTARFRCCVALANPSSNTDAVIFEATCEGLVARAPSGAGGFGYDPIFWLPELGCTMADLTAEQKHSISHRGKVLRMLGTWLAKGVNAPSGR